MARGNEGGGWEWEWDAAGLRRLPLGMRGRTGETSTQAAGLSG